MCKQQTRLNSLLEASFVSVKRTIEEGFSKQFCLFFQDVSGVEFFSLDSLKTFTTFLRKVLRNRASFSLLAVTSEG